MPSFLIVHCASQDGRLDAYRQPPTLDVGGLRVPLDWGDITLHVPAGDLPVTVFVTRASGQVEGAKITVRAPAGTGTRLTFVPPLQPGGASHLRIDGQWPADSSMYYYAARDARTLAPPAVSSVPTPTIAGGRQVAQAGLRTAGSMPAPASGSAGERFAPMAPAVAASPQSPPRSTSTVSGAQPPAVPPVGPTPGSTASVPPQASSFGHQQGALVDPVVAAQPPGPQPPAHHEVAQQGSQAPSFGQRRQPPPILTPAEFDRLEREAQEQQVRAYEAWAAQQRAQGGQHAPVHRGGAPTAHDGAPSPVGLPATSTGQAPAAWYPDPYRRADARWFDGHQWTSSVMRAGARAQDLPG